MFLLSPRAPKSATALSVEAADGPKPLRAAAPKENGAPAGTPRQAAYEAQATPARSSSRCTRYSGSMPMASSMPAERLEAQASRSPCSSQMLCSMQLAALGAGVGVLVQMLLALVPLKLLHRAPRDEVHIGGVARERQVLAAVHDGRAGAAHVHLGRAGRRRAGRRSCRSWVPRTMESSTNSSFLPSMSSGTGICFILATRLRTSWFDGHEACGARWACT